MSCLVRCLGTQQHSDIVLSHGIAVTIGRSSDTKIKDKRVSRQQICLTANFDISVVTAVHIGSNASSIGNKINDTQILKNGDTFSLLKTSSERFCNHFDYSIIFVNKKTSKDGDDMTNISSLSSELMYQDKKCLNFMQIKSLFGKFVMNKIAHRRRLLYSNKNENFNCEAILLDKQMEQDMPEVYVLSNKLSNLTNDDEGILKIAAFDLDGTLIIPRSGKVFPIDKNDWKILYPEIPGKLKELHRKGFEIVIVTNQMGISTGRLTIADFCHKVENIFTTMGSNIPITLFCCTSSQAGLFRKPKIGIWNLLLFSKTLPIKNSDEKDISFHCNTKECFYVGDAAGRNKGWKDGKKKDFSNSDRFFANNIRVKFYTPEEYFLGSKTTLNYSPPSFDPVKFLSKSLPLLQPLNISITRLSADVVLMVGIMGSGKSFFVSKYFVPAGYQVISNDVTGSRNDSLRLLNQALSSGVDLVVIDNTHPDVESRSFFLEAIRRFENIKIRCFVMNVSADHARHNNIFRQICHQGVERSKNRKLIKEPVFQSFISKFKQPSLTEGFHEIVEVNFVPSFSSPEDESLYKLILLEK